MSRYNTAAAKKQSKVVLNHEGEEAYAMTPELELYAAVCTSALDDKFYESKDERVDRIRKLVKKVDPEFVAKLAVYAREEMYLRTMPLALLTELAKVHNGDDLLARATNRTVQRADELTELLACYAQANGREVVPGKKYLGKLSNQMRRGLGMAFNKFDEYQFAKYNRDGAIKLRDALFVVHPTPTGKNKTERKEKQLLFDKIVNDELEVPYTWEVELSKGGDKKKTWEQLIKSGKVGYMALLRNLRNIIEAGVSQKHLNIVLETLADPAQVAKSKQFPFRFLSAYRELKENKDTRVPEVLDALEEAILASAQNIKGFDSDTTVVIACDVSGSMQSTISEKSKVQNYDIGLVLGMLLNSRCKSTVTGMFGDDWKVIAVPKKSILRNADEFHKREGEVGYSTNGWKVIADLLKRKEYVDKVMMFTDCELWDSSGYDTSLKEQWKQYRKEINPKAQLYLFDLAGHGSTPLELKKADGVALIAGWSDKVFNVLASLEKGGTALGEIDKIVL